MPDAPRSRPTFLYLFIRGLVRLLLQIVWRMKIEGQENIPKTGAMIVAPNHRSFGDPPIVGAALRREVHFLAKKELFAFRPFGWLITNLNAHPLNRGGDIAAIREAARILKSGGALIIFPEGRRMKTDELGPAKAGIGALARVGHAPVVPTYVHNSGHMLGFRRLRVVFGVPIAPDGFDSHEALAAEVMRRVAELKARLTAQPAPAAE